MINSLLTNTTDTPIVFSDTLSANTKKTYSAELTGNGRIKQINITFATGENGTLHLTPYVIWNGNIRKDLLNYADGADKYIAGDGVNFKFDSYVPIETHAKLCLDADNTGTGASYVDMVVIVEYEDISKPKTIIGSKGGSF